MLTWYSLRKGTKYIHLSALPQGCVQLKLQMINDYMIWVIKTKILPNFSVMEQLGRVRTTLILQGGPDSSGWSSRARAPQPALQNLKVSSSQNTLAVSLVELKGWRSLRHLCFNVRKFIFKGPSEWPYRITNGHSQLKSRTEFAPYIKDAKASFLGTRWNDWKAL